MPDAPNDTPTKPPEDARKAEVEAVLAEFNGDALAAIAALLHDLEMLAADRASAVSFGYVRGQKVRAGGKA